MHPSLDGTWAKVERAKEHRDALERHAAETFAVEANRPRLGAKFDPNTGENVLFVNYMPDLRNALQRASLLIGDSMHCLRSALDHLVFQLAVRKTKGKIRHERALNFPIETAPDKWRTECKRGLREIAPRERAVIERYQGYHRIHEGGLSVGTYFHPLVMLDDLDNADKHRLLTTVMIPPSGWDLQAGTAATLGLFSVMDLMERTLTGTAEFETAAIELGTVVTRPRHLPPLESEVEMAGYVSPVIALPEMRPAVQVIDKIAASVIDVIRQFEPFP